MAEAIEQASSQQQPGTPTKQSFQGGIRTTGRAFNSPNWRLKTENSPDGVNPRSSRQSNNSPRSSLGRMSPQVPQAITEGRRLYVGNMPYMAKKEDVEALFREGDYKIQRVDISIDPFTGRNPSYCFVELESREQADQAMTALNGKDLLGRPVKIKPGVAKSSPERAFSRTPESPSQRPNDRSEDSPFTFDRWQRNDASTHFKGYSEEGRRLYVGGLPRLSNQEAVDVEIQNLFKGCTLEAISKLISPHPSKRFEPGNHYYLFVDFATADEATRAQAAFDGQDSPWGGKIRVGKARGESWKPEERQRWTAAETTEATSAAAAAAAAA